MSIAFKDLSGLTSEEWSAREEILNGFEHAWRRGERPALEEYLPSGEQARRAVLLELVQTELEYRLRAAESARVEDYLERFPDLRGDPAALLELIEAEIRWRRRREPGLSLEEFELRFPVFATALSSFGVAGSQAATRRLPSPGELVAPAACAADPVHQQLLREPRSIQGYQVIEEWGRGGMGVVYKAIQTSLHRVVALKMVRSGEHAGEQDLIRLQREAVLVGRIRHPNIVQVFDVGTHDGRLYLTLEFVDGGNLAERMRGTPQPIAVAAELSETLARAVQAAHEAGVIHRDLKPSNVLMTSDGIPKITDFGLARPLQGDSDLTRSGDLVGTPAYMAPEQARDPTRSISPACDTYALGVILYELLTGRPPFQAAGAVETVAQVMHQEPVSPRRLRPTVPRDLETICLKCLEKEPGRRYATALELAEDLRRFRAGETIRARPVGLAEGLWRQCRRKPDRAALVVLLVVLLAAAGLAALELKRRVQVARIANQQVNLLARLKEAEIDQVPAIVEALGPYRPWAEPRLREIVRRSDQPRERLHARLALLPSDPGQAEPLFQDLLRASTPVFLVLRQALDRFGERFREPLWTTALDARADRAVRLRSAAALAAFDPTSPRWAEAAGPAVEMLVAENPAFVRDWIEAFRPIRPCLLEPLGAVFRDASKPVERTTATSYLLEFASDRPDVLFDLALDADERQVRALWPVLEDHRQAAITVLEGELARTPNPVWTDRPLDPAWSAPSPELAQQVEDAAGMLTERFAFCLTLPLDRFAPLAEGLRASGYRPIRLRPYAADGKLVAAAVWTRDGREWQMTLNVTAEETKRQDADWKSKGFVSQDVACYHDPSIDHTAAYSCAALWRRAGPGDGDARMYVAVPEGTESGDVSEALLQSGYQTWTRQTCQGRDGRLLESGICRKDDSVRTDVLPDQGFRPLDGFAVDLSTCRTVPAPSFDQRIGQYLVLAEERVRREAGSAEALLFRAVGRIASEQYRLALADVDSVLAKQGDNLLAVYWHVQAAAGAGDREAALKDLALLRARGVKPSWLSFLEAVASIRLGDAQEGLKRLDLTIAENPADSELLYNAACAYALACHRSMSHPAKARAYADRAVALLRDALARGYSNFTLFQIDFDLEPLRGHPGFDAILCNSHPAWRTMLVWHIDSSARASFASRELLGVDPADHSRRSRELAGQGYRPAAISAIEGPAGGRLVIDSVWHRPITRDDDIESLARRQANAAALLVRLGKSDRVWPLLRHRADPRVRAWLYYRLGPLEADPNALVKHFEEEQDVSARRGLILSLGEFPPSRLSEETGQPLVDRLLHSYRNDPDPGLHSALEWLLRRWGHGEDVKRIQRELAGTARPEKSGWHLTREGHSMVVVPGPVEFLMGSPANERDRSPAEQLHHRQISRTFEIATKEVTVEQFLRYWTGEHAGQPHYAQPDGLANYTAASDAPMLNVTWFEAAGYCRWLSRQEGIPEDQMCYPPMAEIGPGMKLPANYLARTGYRLPTEAEWEYACRAGSVTARSFGSAPALLPSFAWHRANSGDRAQAVGSLEPNDLGLFDLYGNAWEWCQNRMVPYARTGRGQVLEDAADPGPIDKDVPRVLRGGAFDSRLSDFRSAHRFSTLPGDHNHMTGLRVARTRH